MIKIDDEGENEDEKGGCYQRAPRQAKMVMTILAATLKPAAHHR